MPQERSKNAVRGGSDGTATRAPRYGPPTLTISLRNSMLAEIDLVLAGFRAQWPVLILAVADFEFDGIILPRCGAAYRVAFNADPRVLARQPVVRTQ